MAAADILVVLSTHNGARFIAQQLASLRAQTAARRIHLLIRDDASSDDTIDIIQGLDLAPLTVSVIRGAALGARDSFAAALGAATGAYRAILWCDQDDVWLPGKVARAAAALAAADARRPTLYAGRSWVTDQDLAVLGMTAGAPRGPSLRHALFQNIAPGHTMAFNQALADLFLATVNPAALMHDWWCYCLGTATGQVIVDATPQAYYRQHQANQIGYAAGRGARLGDDLRRLLGEDRRQITAQAAALRAAVGQRMTRADQVLLSDLLHQDTLSARWRYLRRHPMVAQSARPPLASSALFLLGRYRLGPTPPGGAGLRPGGPAG
jgi:glycosyltransferase involved in cell wall biosynthesis